MKPVYEWCDHTVWLQAIEHVFSPMHSGSLMAPFEYMHIPGIDLLGRDVANARLAGLGVPVRWAMYTWSGRQQRRSPA